MLLAANILATKVDSLQVDNNSNSQADPGDTIRYEVVVSNSGTTDAMDVEFADTLQDSMLVPGSLNVSPLAFDDVYNAVGNTLLEVGVTASGAPAVTVPAGQNLMANDVEFLGDTSHAVVPIVGGGTTQGGTVTVDASGNFTYVPPVAFTGNDTFTYTLMDSGGLSTQGLVTITVSEMVWYVDNAAPIGGDGSAQNPFNSLSPVNSPGGVGDFDADGDTIFVYESGVNYSSGLQLENNQRLIGEGVDLVVAGSTLVTAGSRPTLGDTIDLASNNVISGLNVNATNARGISGTSVGNLTINTLNVSSTNAGGVVINGGGTLNVNIDAVNVNNGGADGGISLSNVGGSTTFGGVAVTVAAGGGTALSANNAGILTITGSGNTISTIDSRAISITGTTIGVGDVTFQSVSVNSPGAGTQATNAITLSNTGSSGGLTITGDGSTNRNASGGTIQNINGVAVQLTDTRDVSLSHLSILNVADQAINGTGVTNLTLNHSLLDGIGNADDENALHFVVGAGNALAGTLNINNTQIIHYHENALEVENHSGTLTANITGSSIDDNDDTNGGDALFFE
jgi:uncharacterized repeat protein (TIGR01451 family)